MLHCTDPHIGRLIARYELDALEEGERDVFEGHLVECAYCHNEVYSMAPIMRVLRTRRQRALQRESVGGRTGGPEPIPALAPVWRRRPILLAASVLMTIGAALLGFYVFQPQMTSDVVERPDASTSSSEVAGGASSPWADLKIPKAVYNPSSGRPIVRGGEPATAFERAMADYERSDFAAAAERLEVVTRLEPEQAEAHFYRGVSLLLQEKSRDAIAPLREAVRLSAGEQREQNLYYLALAYLKTNQPHQALTELEAILAMDGSYRAEAEKLRQAVRSGLR